MAWMIVEVAVAIILGIIASSIALVGFGRDSVIEFFAAAAAVWQLRGDGRERETRAVRLIGVTFFVLAAYLAVESMRDLIGHVRLRTVHVRARCNRRRLDHHAGAGYCEAPDRPGHLRHVRHRRTGHLGHARLPGHDHRRRARHRPHHHRPRRARPGTLDSETRGRVRGRHQGRVLPLGRPHLRLHQLLHQHPGSAAVGGPPARYHRRRPEPS